MKSKREIPKELSLKRQDIGTVVHNIAKLLVELRERLERLEKRKR